MIILYKIHDLCHIQPPSSFIFIKLITSKSINQSPIFIAETPRFSSSITPLTSTSSTSRMYLDLHSPFVPNNQNPISLHQINDNNTGQSNIHYTVIPSMESFRNTNTASCSGVLLPSNMQYI